MPELFIQRPTVTGALDSVVVRRTLKRGIARIRYCYESQPRSQGLVGTATFQLELNGDGHVTSVTATGAPNKEVEACETKAIQSAPFPKPTDGHPVTVSIPIVYLHPAE